jgi:hypothetical protein
MNFAYPLTGLIVSAGDGTFHGGCISGTCRMATVLLNISSGDEAMTLNASLEELEIIRTALHEYRNNLRDRERGLCTGYSAAGIDLCVQRLNVENVIVKLEEGPASPPTVLIPLSRPNRLHESLSKSVLRSAA